MERTKEWLDAQPICPLTGLRKITLIEYFLEGKSLGKTFVSEGSLSNSRIAEAKAIGIDYYDGFILREKNDSREVIMPDGKPMDDFNNWISHKGKRAKELNND